MALTPEKIAELKAACKAVKKRPLNFFYCAAGADGDPTLLIGKNILKEAKALKKSAKKRKFVKGKVVREAKRLQFLTETPAANKFPKNLKTYFGSKILDLKKAEVRGLEQPPPPEQAPQAPAAQPAPAAKPAPDIVGPDDAQKVAALKTTFAGEGMDEARAERAAKVAVALEKKGITPEKAAALTRMTDCSGSGTVEDSLAVAQSAAMFPTKMLENMKGNGTKLVACRESVTDHLTHLKGVTPRGWPKKMTWDKVPGAGGKEQVIIGTRVRDDGSRGVPKSGEGHSAFDLMGHEAGHAFDYGSTPHRSASATFRAARQADVDEENLVADRDNYFLQGGDAGPQETFAESCARFFGNDPNFKTTWPKVYDFWKSDPFGLK